jgi:EpsI family protein
LALAIAALAPLSAYSDSLGSTPDAAASVLRWPTGLAGWSGPLEEGYSDWQPTFAGAAATGLRSYRQPDGRAVWVYQALYRSQRQGAELVGGANTLLGADSGWSTAAAERTIDWQELRVRESPSRESILRARWRVDGREFVRPLASQLWYGLRAWRRPVPSSILALRAACEPDCATARVRLTAFERAMPLKEISR